MAAPFAPRAKPRQQSRIQRPEGARNAITSIGVKMPTNGTARREDQLPAAEGHISIRDSALRAAGDCNRRAQGQRKATAARGVLP